MMMKVTPNLVVVLMSAMLLMASSTSAFSSPSGYRKMKKVGFITPQGTTSVSKTTGINPSFLKMAEGGEGEAEKAVASSDGTFYDDDTPQYKDPLSDSMRARLMKEANTGLDPNAKQTNVILYIGIGVAILVILGGSGILY